MDIFLSIVFTRTFNKLKFYQIGVSVNNIFFLKNAIHHFAKMKCNKLPLVRVGGSCEACIFCFTLSTSECQPENFWNLLFPVIVSNKTFPVRDDNISRHCVIGFGWFQESVSISGFLISCRKKISRGIGWVTRWSSGAAALNTTWLWYFWNLTIGILARFVDRYTRGFLGSVASNRLRTF